ncbi:bifunctional diguanylate cyclase/phosphodiesterase [Rhodoferax ferrireducens]|uniref:putative bifunctional diguanylate cyclase/phosphodiesterase n=1 Tax=Rhodoferax ferrireducens TaxID=192843 RepID=UPI00298DEBC7|nr:bifunctional diguanylate cyclase/phosphodiesterase [Rhodoferax ferrireducens]WPC67339.1 bifunctional diguanylate cyclase/phosphodiesterase [Rhodoferax ferrireducens]
MCDHSLSYCPDTLAAHDLDPSRELGPALVQANLPDTAEKLGLFGRWWCEPQSGQWVLSTGAASLLDVGAGLHPTGHSCFEQVVPDDVLRLTAGLREPGQAIACEFRIINEFDGLRWLRMVSEPHLGPGQALQTGVVVDVTSSRLAAMRERFCFESTQFLIGTPTLGEAVTKVIQLVCDNLGWECGAYWSLEQSQMGEHRLACQHEWHQPDCPLASFIADTAAIRLAPGEDLVGNVWRTMQPAWVEDMVNDQDFVRRKSAHACGLQSGYAFAVSSVTLGGRRHSHGVLEFYSSLSRQREAQLPGLAATIGELIAQTVQRLEQQELIRQLAQVDDLTGLANRKHFHHLLDAACLSATSSGTSFAVLNIDLDRFKQINDAFGHEAGNLVLHEFAQRLQRLGPAGSALGRLGGDEFALLVTPAGSAAQLQALGERVLLAARQPFLFERQELTMSASVGISIFPDDGWTGSELMRCADAAMYRRKHGGRNGLSFFSSATSATLAEQRSALARQLTMEAELQRALLKHEFFLAYQPVFGRDAEHMVAVEALIRWRRPGGDVVPPDLFIPVAEQSGLIVQIGRWVVKQACHDLAQLHRAGFTDLQVNVNMAAPEFVNPNLPGELMAVLQACGVAPRHLCLELTEGLVMKQPDKVIPVMAALRQLGCKVSLDDFGMGHSSLSRMKMLPISSLKIDRSFVGGLPDDRGDAAIVRTILDLGRHMKLQVIAEGVETDAQLLFLRQFGCTLIQGFLLGRPKTVPELMAAHPQTTRD